MASEWRMLATVDTEAVNFSERRNQNSHVAET
jgi:hypothetical protein